MGRAEQHVEDPKYVVIPRVLIFLFKGNEVLLIKGSSKKRIWAGCYNGVGGHVEKSESVLEAARRELKEETGLETTAFMLCGTVMVDIEKQMGVCVYLFCGSYQSGELVSSTEGDIEWININEIGNMSMVGDLPVLLPEIIKSKKNRVVFHAKAFYDVDGHLRVVITS